MRPYSMCKFNESVQDLQVRVLIDYDRILKKHGFWNVQSIHVFGRPHRLLLFQMFDDAVETFTLISNVSPGDKRIDAFAKPLESTA